jgi:1-acyl-sn-glycerol-3-phosphate acyltransferase
MTEPAKVLGRRAAATKAATKATAKPATKATAKPATKATAKPATKATAKPATKATPKPATKAAPKRATRAAPKPPATRAAPKPPVKPASRPSVTAASRSSATAASATSVTSKAVAKATKVNPRAAEAATSARNRKPAAAKATLSPRSTARIASRANGAGPVTNRRVSAAVPVLAEPTAVPSRNGSAVNQTAVNGHPYQGTLAEPDAWDERVAGFLRFFRRRITGQYEVDEFGFDPELTAALVHPPLRALYRHYFRVDTIGADRLPAGGALIVANHSGTLPIDALMLSMAVHDETPTRRNLRLLAADLVFRLPFLSEAARKAGTTLACSADAERMLRTGEYVGVFPEGFKGIGKPYRERYKLQRFGRGGFVSAALRTGTPIVPAAIVGAEEIYPIIANLRPLARVTGLPYVPVTPLFPWLGPLGMLPLPSKWLIEFGEPIETAQVPGEADDPIVVFNLADQVRETIQHTLHGMLERRPDPFG